MFYDEGSETLTQVVHRGGRDPISRNIPGQVGQPHLSEDVSAFEGSFPIQTILWCYPFCLVLPLLHLQIKGFWHISVGEKYIFWGFFWMKKKMQAWLSLPLSFSCSPVVIHLQQKEGGAPLLAQSSAL